MASLWPEKGVHCGNKRRVKKMESEWSVNRQIVLALFAGVS